MTSTQSPTQTLTEETATFLPQPAPTKPPPTTTLRIYILCIANFGISFIWALEFALTTPFFQQILHASHITSHLVWILGPISGLIVAPLVGYYSDRCTSKYGRRRPFIVCGTIVAAIGILMFCNAPQITKTIFGEGVDRMKLAVPIAVVGFGIMDFSINGVMWPVRSLQGDLVERDLQHDVQAANVAMGSAGDLVANCLLGFFEMPVGHVSTVFGIGLIVFVVSVGVILVVAEEVPWGQDGGGVGGEELLGEKEELGVMMEEGDEVEDGDEGDMGRGEDNVIWCFGLPWWFWKLGFAYFLCFASFFAIVPNISSWMGETVMGGDSDAPEGSAKALLFDKGVGLYGKAGLLRGVIQIAFSATYPRILKTFGGSVGGLLSLSFFCAGIVILTFAGTTSIAFGVLVVAFLAIAMAAVFTLPVAMVVQRASDDKRGVYLGALNIFAVIPQMMDTSYTGVVSTVFGEDWVMRIGAMWAILAAVASVVLIR